MLETTDSKTETCPTCGKTITFETFDEPDGSEGVEILHPQPPCSGFQDFVERLVARARRTQPPARA